MKRHLFAHLALVALLLAGCSSLEMPGSAMYFANQPGGTPFFRITSGISGPMMSINEAAGQWSKPRKMKTVAANEPPLSITPGLAEITENAHGIDGYVFLEFKPDAKVRGQPLPSRYFLLPGGFAYPVPAP